MKRLSLSVVSVLFFSLVLFSCTQKNEKPVNVEAKVEQTAKRIVIWEQDDASIMPFVDSVLRAFEALPENAGLKITRVHYGNEELRQQFQTVSIGGTPPDLIISPSDPAGVYSVSGFLLPVDGLFDLTRYAPNTLGAIRMDGKTWGIPISMGNHLMLFYNKKLVPNVPVSTDELFSFCDSQAKTKEAGTFCMAFDMGEPFWMVPWLGAFSGWPLDKRAPTLDTQPMREVLKFYADLKAKKYIPGECDYNCADALFKEAKVPFLINGDWAISSYASHFKKDLGIARIPELSTTKKWPSPMVSGKYFMLSASLKGEQLELIKKFINFYTSPENQLAQVKAINRLPSRVEVAGAEFIKKDPLLQASMDQITVGKPMPMETEMRAVWDAMRPQLRAVVTGKTTPDQAAKAMMVDALKKISEMH